MQAATYRAQPFVHEQFDDLEQQRGAAQLGPAEHCDGMIGRERQQRGEAVGRRIGAHRRLRVPRRVGRVGRGEHLGAQPPQRRPIGMVMQQTSARDDEGGGIVVELTEAIGGLGDQEPVVATVAGDGPESFERLHCLRTLPAAAEGRAGAHRREGGVEPRKDVGVPREQVRAATNLQRTPGQGVLRAQ